VRWPGLTKLQVCDRAQLVMLGYENGVVSPGRVAGPAPGAYRRGLGVQRTAQGLRFRRRLPMEPGTAGEDERDTSHTRLAYYWARLGFELWQGQIMVLDLNLSTFDESVAAAGIRLI
jgi:hypothetical protein